jgi:uncharacterized protein (DUF2164 family)
MNRYKNKFTVSKEKRNEMAASIKLYFSNERNEELGDLAAGLFLDFIMEELAVEFYNQGVYDSYTFMNAKVEDLLGIQK